LLDVLGAVPGAGPEPQNALKPAWMLEFRFYCGTHGCKDGYKRIFIVFSINNYKSIVFFCCGGEHVSCWSTGSAAGLDMVPFVKAMSNDFVGPEQACCGKPMTVERSCLMRLPQLLTKLACPVRQMMVSGSSRSHCLAQNVGYCPHSASDWSRIPKTRHHFRLQAPNSHPALKSMDA
jgi:hypothetical protein